jgi:hypothetical protein
MLKIGKTIQEQTGWLEPAPLEHVVAGFSPRFPCFGATQTRVEARDYMPTAHLRQLLQLAVVFLLFVWTAAAQSSNTYIFPFFVDGTASGISYRSTLKLNKTSTTNVLQCTLTQRNTSAPFVGVDGYVYSADVFDGGFSPPAQTQITLDPFLPWEILRTNAQSPLRTGYAKLTCPGAVEAQLQFSLSDANNKLGEATILPATQGRSFQFLIDRRDGTRLGISLANDSAASGDFIVVARDRFNYEVDRAYVMIEPWSQVSKFVDEVVSLPPDFVGSIELVGLNGGQSYAVGFQFTGTVFTTIQPIVRAAPIPN